MLKKIKELFRQRISMLFSPHLQDIDADHNISVFTKPPTSNVCIVTSTIQFGKGNLSYSSKRSIYSPEERLKQTLQSLGSVRAKIPDCFIILLENSEITKYEIKQLQERADWIVCFRESPNAITLRDGLHKGAGEVYMILKILKMLRYFNYEKLFKLSGRYCLNEKFDIKNFSPDKFGVLKTESVYSTRLYCVPKTQESIYIQQLAKMLKLAQQGAGIEAVFMRGVSIEHIYEMPHLGVRGYIGLNGILIDE